MANPERVRDPNYTESVDALPPLGVDPLITTNPRLAAANTQDPALGRTVVVEPRRSGSGVLIAAVVLVLAVVAYFVFAPGMNPTTATPPAATDTTAPAAPAAEAPAAMAPADTTAPASSAPAAMDSAAPATNEATPAPAPATPAPAN